MTTPVEVNTVEATGLTLTFEGGDTYIATMSNGTHFAVRQEDWSVKTDYYLETFVHYLPDLVRDIRATGNRLESVLEMGIARGVLSIGVALLTDDATRIIGIDIEDNARGLVAANAADNGVGHKIAVRIGDMFDPVSQDETFDLVFGEMPFIPVDPVLQEQWIDQGHASEILNVSGGPDGRKFVDALIAQGARHVREGGALMLAQPSFIGVETTLDLMAAHGLQGRVAVAREWRLADTRFTLRSRPYIESLYPSAFSLNDAGDAVFSVTIVVAVKQPEPLSTAGSAGPGGR
jgi:Ribosomal protein L11 methyltransferase (PrmA)